MNLCLDTNVVIEIFRGRQPHYRRYLDEAERDGHKVQLSSLVLHELLFGARISRQPERELNLIDRFVGRANISPWSAEDALSAADVRADLAAAGSPIGVLDALIAGQVLNQGWTLVTANIREFIRVCGLPILDWSDPAGVREIDRNAWRAHPPRPAKDPK